MRSVGGARVSEGESGPVVQVMGVAVMSWVTAQLTDGGIIPAILVEGLGSPGIGLLASVLAPAGVV